MRATVNIGNIAVRGRLVSLNDEGVVCADGKRSRYYTVGIIDDRSPGIKMEMAGVPEGAIKIEQVAEE